MNTPDEIVDAAIELLPIHQCQSLVLHDQDRLEVFDTSAEIPKPRMMLGVHVSYKSDMTPEWRDAEIRRVRWWFSSGWCHGFDEYMRRNRQDMKIGEYDESYNPPPRQGIY